MRDFPWFRAQSQVRANECRPKFCNYFLGGVSQIPESLAQLTVATSRLRGPVDLLVTFS